MNNKPSKLRFSLRSLWLAILLFAAGGALGKNWDAWVCVFRAKCPQNGVTVAFSSDAERVFAIMFDRGYAFDLRTGRQTLEYELGFHATPRDAQYRLSNDGTFLAYQNYNLSIWETGAGAELHKYHEGSADQFAIADNGILGFIRHGFRGGKKVHILNPASSEMTTFEMPDIDEVGGFAMSPNGATFIASDSAQEISARWDAKTGERLNTVFPKNSAVEYAEFSPDGTRVVAALKNNVLAVADAVTGQRLLTQQIDCQGNDELVSASLSPDNRRAAAVTKTGVHILDSSSGAEVLSFGSYERGASAAFSRDGTQLAIGGKEITVWKRKHDELLAGYLKMPELWLTAIFGIALVISLKKDRERFRAQA